MAFHGGRPLNSESHLEKAVSLPAPKISMKKVDVLLFIWRNTLLVSFLYMMDAFKVQSFLSGEGKWEILDN